MGGGGVGGTYTNLKAAFYFSSFFIPLRPFLCLFFRLASFFHLPVTPPPHLHPTPVPRLHFSFFEIRAGIDRTTTPPVSDVGFLFLLFLLCVVLKS